MRYGADLIGAKIIMSSIKAIPRLSLYSKLLLPIIFAVLLGLFIIQKGVRPDPIWVAFDIQKAANFHPSIWVMVSTGLTGFLLGAWIWIIQPKSLPAFLFALSGFATLAFTFSPLHNFFATPVSEEMAIHMSRLNMYGASLFGIVMCALLLIYPSRLPFYRYLLPLMVGVFVTWTVWASVDLKSLDYSVQLITFVEMMFIVILSIWQIIISRGKADKHAVSIWLSACVIIGSGPFIALIAAPMTFGYNSLIPAYYAFAFFNLVYIGFAIGLLRLRLFDLGSWTFQLLFHAGFAILFIAIDFVLMSSLALQKGVASTFTILALAIVYLPIRGWLSTAVTGHKKISEADMFQSVVETGLKPSGAARALSWVTLLRETFKPVQMSESLETKKGVSVSSDGQTLSLPAAMDAPALVLRHKYKGRALFSMRDQKLATQILTLINQVDDSRRAYDRGVNEERSRIGRDIHDNIGAQLLQALHSEKTDKKDEMIRDSLSDLRDVINNASSVEIPLSDMLADLRAETVERADSHNLLLNWSSESFTDLELPSHKLHALRSVLREAVSNVLKHAEASNLDVSIKKMRGGIEFSVKDNGNGMAQSNNENRLHEGQGLKNMRSRVESLDGDFDITSTNEGVCLTARFDIGAKQK